MPDASRSAAYLSGTVHRDEMPILLAVHDDDGEWQFLDGGVVNDEDGVASGTSLRSTRTFGLWPICRRDGQPSATR